MGRVMGKEEKERKKGIIAREMSLDNFID